ncbi:MAG: hypothetical protein K2X66_17585 [Cyanobacteria bacterium]|nr:hypothetical protein [Cyanobacteriota bacterium]
MLSIHEKSADCIELVEKPVYLTISAAIFAVLCFGFVIGLFIISPLKSTFMCSRDENECRITQHFLTYEKVLDRFTVRTVKEAKMEWHHSRRHRSSYSLLLTFKDHRADYSFWNPDLNGEKEFVESKVDLINNYLEDHSALNLWIELSQESSKYWLAAIFTLIGLLMLFMVGAKKKVLFDKANNKMILEQTWFMGLVLTDRVIPLRKVEHVRSVKSFARLQAYYFCEVVLGTGETVNLHFSPINDVQEAHQIVSAVETFLFEFAPKPNPA